MIVTADAIRDLDRGAKVTIEDQSRVEAAVQRVERLNPVRATLTNPDINGEPPAVFHGMPSSGRSHSPAGKWRLVYTTSRSILGLDKPEFLRPKGPIFQFIDVEKKKAKNQVKTLSDAPGGREGLVLRGTRENPQEPGPFFNSVVAELIPENDRKVLVQFKTFFIGGLIPVIAPANAIGDLETTYVDAEMRISRGNKGNVFVLLQEDPSARL